MKLNLELSDMQLIKEEFEIFAEPFSHAKKIKSNIEIGLKLGFATESESREDIKLVANYEIKFKQVDTERNKSFSKDSITYLFIFEDKNNNVIDNLATGNLSAEDEDELGFVINSISYPYIKEYLETRYKKSNIEIKLPLTLNKTLK